MKLEALLSEASLYSPRAQALNQAVALVLIAALIAALWANIGLPPTIIVGGSALIGFLCWRATNLRRPLDTHKTVMLFLATVAALHVHMIEEHVCLFGPAMSRLFEIAFPDERFLRIFVFAGPIIYYLTAIGLLLRVPFAAFVAWFIFIGPGLAEVTHFVFPLLPPALEPDTLSSITAAIGGETIAGMANHSLRATGVYYFPGMYTAVLPMIPGAYAVWWLMRNGRAHARASAGPRG